MEKNRTRNSNYTKYYRLENVDNFTVCKLSKDAYEAHDIKVSLKISHIIRSTLL